MNRHLELTLPRDAQAGAHHAFGIILTAYFKVPKVDIKQDGGDMIYGFHADYDRVEDIAAHALQLFPLASADFLDVAAGLHFSIKRNQRMRVTGDDR